MKAARPAPLKGERCSERSPLRGVFQWKSLAILELQVKSQGVSASRSTYVWQSLLHKASQTQATLLSHRGNEAQTPTAWDPTGQTQESLGPFGPEVSPECPRECPRKWGVSEGVSDGECPRGSLGPGPRSVQKVSRECPRSVKKVSGHSGDTLGTLSGHFLDTPGTDTPSDTPHFRGHSRGHSGDTSGP